MISFNGRQLIYLRDLLHELILRDIKLRYKRSVMGVAWSLLVPLAQLLVLYFVFRLVLPLDIPNYTTFLFAGILPWSWFQSSLVAASNAVVDNRNLVRQVGFTTAVLPAVPVMSQLVHFLLALPILFVFLLSDGYRVTAALVALPAVILLQLIFTLGLAYLVATLQVRFRDTQYLLGILLFLFFYLTPVFYDTSVIPARYSAIFQLNPMAHLLAAYRSVLIHGQFPEALSLLTLCSLCLAVLAFGYMMFMRAHYRFVEEL